MQWQRQAGNITTDLKFIIGLTSPEFSATKIVTWDCYVNDSTKGGFNMILSRYILTALVLNP